MNGPIVRENHILIWLFEMDFLNNILLLTGFWEFQSVQNSFETET